MSKPVVEGDNLLKITATGTTVVTSGFAQIFGVQAASSLTGGSVQFFAGTTTSVSLTPLIFLTRTDVSITGNAAFIRMPFVASGSGLTLKYSSTLDPNMLLYWSPVGGP